MPHSPVFLRLLCALALASTGAAGCGDDDGGGAPPDAEVPPDPPTPAVACETALTPVVPEPVTGNGPDELGDADTDGNGILDRDEWGAIRVAALDTDFDETPDHEDVDDDADGLLDVYDPRRLERLELPLEDSGIRVSRALVESAAGDRVARVAREGDTVVLEGTGLDCAAMVVFEGGTTTANVAAAGIIEERGITAVVPPGADGPVFVVVDGVRSNAIPLQVRPGGSPLLYRPTRAVGRAGDTITLRGRGLSSVSAVVFGGAEATPSRTSADEVEFVLGAPEADAGEELVVRAGSVESNTILFRVLRDVSATVVLPAGVSAPGDVSIVTSSLEAHAVEGGEATIATRAAGFDVVTAMAGEDADAVPLLEALVLPDDAEVTLDAQSTAVSQVFAALTALRLVAPESLAELRARIDALPEVRALGAELATALAADAAALTSPPYRDALGTAMVAAQAALDAGLADGSLLPPGMAELAVIAASIEPTIESNMTVIQTANTGNVTVMNGTQLFVSVGIRDIEARVELEPYAVSYFDDNIISPEEGITFSAGSRSYEHPGFRDAVVRIITPGIIGPDVPYGPQSRAQTWVINRTLLERVLLPIVEYAVGNVIDLSDIAELLISHAPDLIPQIAEAWVSGSPTAALDVFIDFVKRELQDPGGYFMTGLVELMVDVGVGAVGRISARLAAKLAPGVGMVETVLSLGVTAGLLLKTANDIVTTPQFIDVNVLFGLGIDNVIPDTMVASCSPRNITLEGAGFWPHFPPGEPGVFPEVHVTDLGGGFVISPPFRADGMGGEFDIRKNGAQIDLILDERYVSQAVGPIRVEVRHDGETAIAPNDIEVDNPLALETMIPRTARTGEMVELRGTDFDTPISVIFEAGDIGTVTVRQSELVSLSETSLRFAMPDLAESMVGWTVRVRRGPTDCARDTNTLVLPGCIEPLGRIGPRAIDINRDGDVLLNNDVLYATDGRTWVIPCNAVALNEGGITAGGTFGMPMRWSQTPDPADPGTCEALPFPSGAMTETTAINRSGTIVGWGIVGPIHALSWAPDGSDPVQLFRGRAHGINDAGDIVGESSGNAFLLPAGAGMGIALGPLGRSSEATALNESAQVVVNVTQISGVRAHVWNAGMLTPIGHLNLDSMTAWRNTSHGEAINESGHVVGRSGDGTPGSQRAFLYLPAPAHGVGPGMYLLSDFLSPSVPWTLGDAVGITDDGIIIGQGTDALGASGPFRMSLNRCFPASAPRPR